MQTLPVPEVAARPLPSFAGALGGLWLLTWRRRLAWRQLPALLAAVLAVPLLACLAAFSRPEHAPRFYQWVVVSYLQVALPLYCLSVLGDVVRGELQANTLVFLATRPLSRARIFVVKFLCEMAWVQLLAATSTILLLGVGMAQGIREAAVLAPVLLAIQVLAVAAYGALSALAGLIHRRFLVVGAIYGLVVEVGIGQIPTNINNLSINCHLRTLLANAESLRDAYDWSPDGTYTSLLILLVAPVAIVGLAALLFTWREYHYTEEMNR